MWFGGRTRIAAVAAIAIGLVIALQAWSGAYTSDFSWNSDEAAHAVSSLAVRDYLTEGFPASPLNYAENYYVHYPKLAIGHWPPLFYTGEAVWMLVFGRGKVAMLAFVGILAAALLLSVFLWVSRDYGALAGAVSALTLCAPQFIQTAITDVSPDIAVALLSFGAAVVLGMYLDRKRSRDAVLFAFLVLAAMGVHGRGALLIFLPFAVLVIGPFRWTKTRAVLLVVGLAAVLILPRLLYQADELNVRTLFHHAGLYLSHLGASIGWPMAALAIIGAIFTVAGTAPRRWLAMPALVLSGLTFHSLINAGFAPRYMITAAPAFAALSGAGFRLCLDALQPAMARAALILAVCGVLIWNAFPLVHKPDTGYHRLAIASGGIDLIAGSALQEGAFVAEMALRDHKLNRIVLRATKVLASDDMEGGQYQLRFKDSKEVLACLDQARVDTVLIERASALPHDAQLLDTLRSSLGNWRETYPYGLPAGVGAFERQTSLAPGEPVIRIDMRYSLGKTLKVGP